MKSASNSLEKKSSLLIKNMDLSNRLSINSNKRPKHHRRNSDMYQ